MIVADMVEAMAFPFSRWSQNVQRLPSVQATVWSDRLDCDDYLIFFSRRPTLRQLAVVFHQSTGIVAFHVQPSPFVDHHSYWGSWAIFLSLFDSAGLLLSGSYATRERSSHYITTLLVQAEPSEASKRSKSINQSLPRRRFFFFIHITYWLRIPDR